MSRLTDPTAEVAYSVKKQIVHKDRLSSVRLAIYKVKFVSKLFD